MVNYSYFYHFDNRCRKTSTPVELSGPRGGGNQVLWVGRGRVHVSRQKYCSIKIFSRKRPQYGEIREKRRTCDFQAKWWQLLLFISLRQIFPLLQLTQCERTRVVWRAPYPSKWTHLHMHSLCLLPPSLRCLCLKSTLDVFLWSIQ